MDWTLCGHSNATADYGLKSSARLREAPPIRFSAGQPRSMRLQPLSLGMASRPEFC